jgi:hypothetical protein
VATFISTYATDFVISSCASSVAVIQSFRITEYLFNNQQASIACQLEGRNLSGGARPHLYHFGELNEMVLYFSVVFHTQFLGLFNESLEIPVVLSKKEPPLLRNSFGSL